MEMCNKLYSLLVSGYKINVDTLGYRMHTPLPEKISGVFTHVDGTTQSMWANYMIELSKLSDLYKYLNKLDKSNTYSQHPVYIFDTPEVAGCRVLKMPNNMVLVDISATVQGDTVLYTINGNDGVSVMNTLRIVDIAGTSLYIEPDQSSISATFMNKSVVLRMPAESDIMGMLSCVPKDIRDLADMRSPYDRSCLYCIAILTRYSEWTN